MIEDQEDRLVAMVQDAGQTWDLSPKDRRAIGAALFAVSALRAEVERLRTAVAPLVAIANAYDRNALDDEARKTWGKNDEHTNTKDPSDIELFSGRGGKRLLTLADCLTARALLGEED